MKKPTGLPTVVRRVARLHGHEGAVTSRADFIVRDQLTFNNRPIVCRFNHARAQLHGLIGWGRPRQPDRIVRRDGAGRMIGAGFFHQVVRGGPVAVTIEERANNSAAQHSGKCFLISFRIERGGYFLAVREAANVQALFIRRAATEARHVWRIRFLETFFTHADRVSRKAAVLAKLKEASGKEEKEITSTQSAPALSPNRVV